MPATADPPGIQYAERNFRLLTLESAIPSTSQSPSIADWPENAREAAQLVIDQYGEPDDVTEHLVTWHKPGPWKRIVASRTVHTHNFPAPHMDSVESVIDYQVPVDKVTLLALNLMHDIATDAKSVQEGKNKG